jgi:hypothetical protein
MPTTVTMTTAGTTTIADAAVDYSTVYATIATALSTIATNSTSIKDNIALIKDSMATIATQTTTVASQTTTLASNSTTITGLATGNGIHIVGAYDVFGMLSIYRLLIEQAKVLENAGTTASPAQITAALAEVARVSQLIKSNIPRDF